MHLIVLTIALVAGQPAADEPAVDPQSQLDTTISFALQLLADEKYQDFIQKLAYPDELEEILKTHEIEDMARSFAKEKAATVTAALKQAKDAEPTLKEEGTIAVFELADADDSKTKIVFEKKGDLWYIRN